MLQIKSLHDPRRPRTNMTGCPARLHNATSPIAGRASPTSGTWRPGFVGLAGGSGRALAGGRAHRGLGGAHWLSKQGAPVGLNCRAVAVETRSARDVPLSTQPSSSDDSETPLALRSVPCLREDVHGTEAGPPSFEGDREQVAATTRPSRPRLPSRTELEGFELVAPGVPLVETPKESPSASVEIDDWEFVSSEDLPALAL